MKTRFSMIFSFRRPNFSPRGRKGGLPLLGAEGPQKWGLRAEGALLTKIYVIFEGICALIRCMDIWGYFAAPKALRKNLGLSTRYFGVFS